MPEAKRKKLLESYVMFTLFLKVCFWFSPLFLIILPLLLHYAQTYDTKIDPLQFLIFFILTYTNLLVIYLERKWLLNFLRAMGIYES